VLRHNTDYAKTDDGVYIAYQIVGDGPIDFVWQFDFFGNIDGVWEHPLFSYLLEGLASFTRLILLDRRGTGESSRNVPPSDLETRAADLAVVLDAIGSVSPVLGGTHEGGVSNAMLAASDPDRARSIVWWEPYARATWAPDYPWGVSDAYLASSREAIATSWGTDAYDDALRRSEQELSTDTTTHWTSGFGKLSRQTATPDVALEMDRIWSATDIRGVLPSVRIPALLMQFGSADRGEIDHIASLMPNAVVRFIAGEGGVTRESLDAEFDVIRQFLELPREPAGIDRELATVLFTDIVGSTELAASVGDARWKQLLAAHDERAKAEVERHRGRYVDSAGDGLFATFDGPARAVRCAQAIGAAVAGLGISIRSGCHTGEVELAGDRVRGLAVHIGARVAALAEAGEVLVSSTVRDLVAGSGLAFEDAGSHELKGVPDMWRLYRVVE
jgi:class 3 adenylate cyclase